MRERIDRIKQHIARNERPLTAISFITGFVWDSLTLTRVDLFYDNAVLTTYILIAALSITILYAKSAGKIRGRMFDRIAPWIPLAIAFAFGGLLSGYLVYYIRGASLAGSWIFILFLALLFILNERFKRHYERLTFQVSVFFIALFSYTIFSVPVLIGAMNAWVFLLSGILSLLLVGALVFALSKISLEKIQKARLPLMASIGGIYLLFNVGYFTNVIPPLPLSLKEIGVYHSVTTLPHGGFRLEYEPAPWYLFYRETNPLYRWSDGEAVYAWSAVFAPTRLEVPILHRWSYYDEKQEGWVEASRIEFSIRGGRDGGYRGYSLKYNVFPGHWRVDVITERGAVIGRVEFEIIENGSREIATEIR